MFYIDTCSYNDYDKVVKFLMEKGISILKRNKFRMIILAEVSNLLLKQMLERESFEEIVVWGRNFC